MKTTKRRNEILNETKTENRKKELLALASMTKNGWTTKTSGRIDLKLI